MSFNNNRPRYSNNNSFSNNRPRRTFDKTENLLFGIRPVIEALNAGKELERVYIQEGLQGELQNELKRALKENGQFYTFVPIEKLNRMTNGNHQGVIAIASEITYTPLENLVADLFERGEVPLLVILDRVTDVRNMGAIARSVACAGAHGIVVPARGSGLINADAVKASAGALHTVPVCREANLKDSIQYLLDSGFDIIAVSEKAEANYYDVNWTQPTAIIMGSEEDGVSDEYMKKCTNHVLIPMKGEIASLNVSVAAGIILFEALKQRS